jgi:predicted transcriptional regulator of viral defense system
MRFLDFKEQLKGFTVFSLADIRMADGRFHRRRLTEWQEKGYIRKVVRGYYVFSDADLSEPALYEIANRIYAPSYVSFETALAYYGLIPESVYGVVSASTRKTARFSTDTGSFSYRTILRRAFFGYTVEEYNRGRFTIAEVEKAVVDYLYLHPGVAPDGDFTALRLNREIFHSKVDKKMLEEYAGRINQKALFKRAKGLLRFMGNA